jgi:hypothetical protein
MQDKNAQLETKEKIQPQKCIQFNTYISELRNGKSQKNKNKNNTYGRNKQNNEWINGV